MPAGERALRIVAGRSLQPSQSDSRAEGRCRRRRTPHDSRASCRGDGANRHRHTVSRDQRRDARPGADGRFWLSDRWTGGRAPAGASRTGARGRLLDPEGSRQSPTGQRRSLCCRGRGHADRLRLPAVSSRARKDGAEFVTAQVTRVGENFLETIGAPLLRGRTITAEDRIMAAPVAVISEPLAKQLFPATEPIGERVTSRWKRSREQEFTIVGVSADFATSQLTTERPQILLPLPEALRADGASHRARRAGRRTKVEGRPGERASRVGRRGVARCGVPRHRHRTRPRREEPGRFDCGVHPPWDSPAASCWFWRRSASSASSGSWWPREHAKSPSGWRWGPRVYACSA